MAAQALIRFEQGPNADVGGRALVGFLSDGAVSVLNTLNTDVTSWSIDLLDVPPGSALALGVLAASVSNTPSASFTPDVAGSYRLQLTVFGVGGTTDIDIRVFAIPLHGKGVIVPPYQRNPDPLPLTGSGQPGAKPDEMNFGGQLRGWAGDNDPDRRLLHQVLSIVDDTVGMPDLVTSVDGDTVVVRVREYNEPIVVEFDGSSAWVLESNYGADAPPALTSVNIEHNTPLARVASTPSTDRFESLVFDGSNLWVAITDTVSSDTYLRKFDLEAGSFSTRNLLHTTAARSIAFGAVTAGPGLWGPYLWVLSADLLSKVTPGAPAGPYTTAAITNGVDVLFDDVGGNYLDGLQRVWVLDAGLPGIRRISTTPTVDSSLTLASTTPRAVTKSSVGLFVLAIDTTGPQAALYRINFHPAAVAATSTSINAVFNLVGGGDIYDVVYDSVTAKLYVYGKNTAGQGVLARVSPLTLDVEASAIVVPSDLPQSGTALPRISMFRGSVWIPVMNGAGDGSVLRVNPTSLAVVTSLPPYKETGYEAGGSTTLTGPQFAARVAGTGAPQAVSPADAAGMLDDQFTQLFINTGALKTIDLWNDGDEGLITFGPDFVAVAMRHTTKTGDTAPVDMAVYPQGAFGTATGINRKSGDFRVQLAAPTNGGTTRSAFVVLDGPTEVARLYRGTAATDGVLQFGTDGFIEAQDFTINATAAFVANVDSARFVATGGSGFAVWSDNDHIEVGNVGGTLLADYGTNGIFYRASAIISMAQTTGGDVAPFSLDIRGSKASTGASGANQVGGPTRLLGGEGRVAGTHKAGDVEVYTGVPLADNTMGSFRILHGTPASTPTVMFSWTRSVGGYMESRITGNHSQPGSAWWVAAYQDFILLEAGNAAYGHLYLTTYCSLLVPSGDLRFLGSSSVLRLGVSFPNRTTVTDATVTTVASWASSGITTPGCVRVFEGWVMVQHTSPDVFNQAWYVKFVVYDIGGVQLAGALTATADATLDDLVGENVVAATPFTLDVSANVVRLRFTGVAACTNRISPTILEYR